MIYAKLLGGIGNISFIIASAYTLALDNQDEAVFSLNLGSITRRKNENWWFTTLFAKIKRSKPVNIKVQYREPSFLYNKIPYYPNMILNGYFQSEKYFRHRREEILELFLDYKQKINNSLQLKMDLLPGKKISLHIRRGDYLKLQHTHNILPIKYYENAIKMMKERLGKDYKDYIYLIFSDDIEWCRKQKILKDLPDVHFVEDSDPLSKGPVEVFQLYLMSMCEHNIIANSSFSWWGSWLNTNGQKIVIAPSKWFNAGGPKDWSTIYTKEMIKCPIN